MVSRYYAGHSMDWIKKFKEAIPEESHLRRIIARSIAEAIQHQYNLTGKEDISLNSTSLKDFDICSKNMKPYLQYFQEAGLLEVSFNKGKAPKIKLVCRPPRYSTFKRKENR